VEYDPRLLQTDRAGVVRDEYKRCKDGGEKKKKHYLLEDSGNAQNPTKERTANTRGRGSVTLEICLGREQQRGTAGGGRTKEDKDIVGTSFTGGGVMAKKRRSTSERLSQLKKLWG